MTMLKSYAPTTNGIAVIALNGRATTDAVAMPTVNGNTTANNNTITGVADTSAFINGDLLQIIGPVQRVMATLGGQTVNTNLRVATTKLITTTEAVTVTKMEDINFYFDLPFCARRAEWNDETNGITWTWEVGMPRYMARKRVWATGVQTTVNAGIFLFNNKLCVGPDVAPPSSVFSFRVDA